jgi:hypothetical protein
VYRLPLFRILGRQNQCTSSEHEHSHQLHFQCLVTQRLSRLDVGFASRSLGLNSGWLHVRFLGRRSGTWANFFSNFFGCSLFIIILPLLHTHLSRPLWGAYHIRDLLVLCFIFSASLYWLQNKEVGSVTRARELHLLISVKLQQRFIAYRYAAFACCECQIVW